MYIYIWFGFQSFRVEDDNPGSPQGSPQHQGDEDGEALDGYPGLLFAGSYALGEEKVFEVRTKPSSSFPERQEPMEPELTEPELTKPETMEVFHVGEAAEV